MTSEAALQTNLSRPYFIGIGGIGMSGLARICAAQGALVAGSDAKDDAGLAALRQAGVVVHVGHDASYLRDASCVVVSQAIRRDNPELVAARERGIPVVHRAQALATLMEGRRGVVVAGTHGKSSTSGMLAVAFERLGLDPSFSVGANLGEPGSNARHGGGEVFIAEADESDRSFHHYRPSVAIVLNVEEDHHDHYSSLDEHLASYETFAQGIQPGGTLVVSADDPGAGKLAAGLAGSRPTLHVVSYGQAARADVRIIGIDGRGLSSTATVDIAGQSRLDVPVNVPGRHMAHNAVGALTVAVAIGIDPGEMAQALGHYRGIDRRLTLTGQAHGVRVFDSYAHHPSEVAADLATAREVVTADGEGRVIVVFQPHLFTRTKALGAEIGRALVAADAAVVLNIYAAREAPIPGVTNRLVVDSARRHGGAVKVEHTWDAVPERVTELAQPGDLVLTMGAGDVTQLGPRILEAIDRRARDGAPLAES